MITLLRYLHIIHKSIIKNIGYFLQQALHLKRGRKREKLWGNKHSATYLPLLRVSHTLSLFMSHRQEDWQHLLASIGTWTFNPSWSVDLVYSAKRRNERRWKKFAETYWNVRWCIANQSDEPMLFATILKVFLLRCWWYQIDVVFHPWISTCSNNTRKRSIIRRFLRKFFFAKRNKSTLQKMGLSF